MTDLVAARYPVAEEEWVLDGQPYPPYRRTISRRDITSTVSLATTNTLMYVYAVAVQAGDVFNFITLAVKTAPTGTIAHSWVALFNGVGTGAALLGQSTDVTTGFTTGGLKLALGASGSDIAQPGTPQGPSSGPGFWSTTPLAGPTIFGVAVYGPGSTAGAVLDGMAAGSVTGEQVLTGQAALASSGTITAGATAPAVLPTMTALAGTTAGGGLPYIVLSKQ
jgi:hypothetical protein